MTKRVITTTEYRDDLDGSTAAGTVTFAFDGTNYEIDLSKANTRAFEKVLKPYVDAARKVRTGRSKASAVRSTSKSSGRHDLQTIRAWAAANGHEVSSRGRISATVLEAYRSAN